MRTLKTYAVLISLLALLLAAGATSVPSTFAARASQAPAVAAADPATSLEAENRQAQDVLARLARERSSLLNGVTVTVGKTPHGEQGVAYYTEGRIVISDTHQVSIDAILAHEAWHIIDWRDNGRMDWGENLPPKDPGAMSRTGN